MKNKYLINALKCLGMILMTASLVNCSKSSSGSSNTSSTGYKCYTSGGTQVDNSQCLNNPYTSYYYCRDNNGKSVSNTSCYATTSTTSSYTCYTNAGQQVSTSLCVQNASSSYYICRNSSGTQVSNSLCTSGTTSSGYTLINGQCYYYNQVVEYSNCLQNGSNGYLKQNCVGNTYYYGNTAIKCGYYGMPGATHECPTGLILQTTSGATIQCL